MFWAIFGAISLWSLLCIIVTLVFMWAVCCTKKGRDVFTRLCTKAAGIEDNED